MYENTVKIYGDQLTDILVKDFSLLSLKLKGVKMFMEVSRLCKKNHWDEDKFANDMRTYMIKRIKEDGTV